MLCHLPATKKKQKKKMQSGGGYGGVSEIQQFMVDNSSLFAISSSSASAATPTADAALAHHPFKYQPQQPTQMPPLFSHFQSIPTTQQLLHQPPPPPPHHHHQYFHLFHPPPSPPPPQPTQQQYLPETRRFIPAHHLGGVAMDRDSCPDNSAAAGGAPPFLASAMSFKLAVDGGSCERIDDDGGMLRGDDVSESRLHHWQREDDSGIEELPWRPLDIDYIDRNNKSRKDEEAEAGSSSNFSKKSKEMVDSERGEVAGGSNYKIFSELEAIYKPGGSANVGQTGSGSALTGEDMIHPVLHAAAVAPPQDAAVGGVSETSAGEEPTERVKSSPSKERSRKRRKRRLRHLRAMAAFFERLVKQLMDHQEGLHRKFLELMEQREQELAGHEQAWRKQNAANSSREAAARAHERALSTSREAAIVSFIEKMTGKHLHLPSIPPQLSTAEELHKIQKPNPDAFNNAGGGREDQATPRTLNTRRWPKAEVQALIGVRSGLECRFHEPGLKGPLWEEVSSAMAAMGYRRNAKRCKEKWENINKYFRKVKEKGRKPPEHSKTCPYFDQLDQLYSKTKNPPSAHLNSPPLDPNTIPTVTPAVGESSRLTPGEEDDEEQRSEEEEEEEEEVEESNGNPMQW
ncbi:hypothetical protein ZIOFF_055548 [Zingiber officinale]|uniref:Myb-like domain-containing protein n=2 Tax=Zingiber officinale TaxID=94328 RepID=A0A8J5FMC1_ZINOF|nr:hypothetical protein ZIOFF_055548 [Zingiber officinale]